MQQARRMIIELPDELFNAEELKRTPERVRKFYQDWAKDGEEFRFTLFPNDEKFHDMVMCTKIPLNSVCAHHLLPFTGVAHVAYIPDQYVVGLSKIPRAVNKFAHRPQMQEKLTAQIADFITERLQPKGVMVIIEATHTCMTIRGVQAQGTVTQTSAVRGVFANPPPGLNPREEFLRFIRK